MKSKRELLSKTKKSSNISNNTSINVNKLQTMSMPHEKNIYSTLATSQNLKSISLNSLINSGRENLFTLPSRSRTLSPEETIEIKIPKPYPVSRYMLIDENLQNSSYTKMLNERYPPRQYLRHNLTSWNKVNKNKYTDINVKLMNPRIKFEDYNFKKITYKSNEIDSNNIRTLTDALDVIEKLKGKLIEYEIANNQNIENSVQCIQNLKEENEFYRNKLEDCYSKFEFISDKFGIDEEFLNENDNKLNLVDCFREKKLKKNFLLMIKHKTLKNKFIKYNYEKFVKRQNSVLRIKGFLGIERFFMIKKLKINIERKNTINNVKNIIESLRYNVYVNKLTQRFLSIKKTIRLCVFMKELKLNVCSSKLFKNMNKKALFKYYLTLTEKVMRILKNNSLKKSNLNKISYINFFKGKNINLTAASKKKKIRALNLLKKLISTSTEKKINKIINLNNKNYILEIYFKKWKNLNENFANIMKYKISIRKIFIKLFFDKFRKQKHNDKKDDVMCNKLKIFSFRLFRDKIKKDHLIYNRKIEKFSKTKELNYKKELIDNLTKRLFSNPLFIYVK